jgi:hypothetical protein
MAKGSHFTSKFFIFYYLMKIVAILLLFIMGREQSNSLDKLFTTIGILNLIGIVIQSVDFELDFMLALEGRCFKLLLWFTYIECMVETLGNIIDLSQEESIVRNVYFYRYDKKDITDGWNVLKIGYLFGFFTLAIITPFFTFLYLVYRLLILLCDLSNFLISLCSGKKVLTVKQSLDEIYLNSISKIESPNSNVVIKERNQGVQIENNNDHLYVNIDNSSCSNRNHFQPNQSSVYVPGKFQGDQSTNLHKINNQPDISGNSILDKVKSDQTQNLINDNVKPEISPFLVHQNVQADQTPLPNIQDKKSEKISNSIPNEMHANLTPSSVIDNKNKQDQTSNLAKENYEIEKNSNLVSNNNQANKSHNVVQEIIKLDQINKMIENSEDEDKISNKGNQNDQGEDNVKLDPNNITADDKTNIVLINIEQEKTRNIVLNNDQPDQTQIKTHANQNLNLDTGINDNNPYAKTESFSRKIDYNILFPNDNLLEFGNIPEAVI